jgi:1-acyl-sn-glycerol-3-phosphate acyltransferase
VNSLQNAGYHGIVGLAKTGFRLLKQRLVLEGTERVPRTGGVLLAVNHISYVDFVYGGLAADPSGRLVRFMAKRELFDHRVGGPVMRSMRHIRVDRDDGVDSYRTALEFLAAGEAVGIFPEATISRSFEIKEIKTGTVRMAAEAGVPVLPVIVWGTQRILTKDHPRDLTRGRTISIHVGEPYRPPGADPAGETVELRSRMATLLDETIRSHPAHEQPPGSWWLPASYGGAAPTPEEATLLDAEERRDRAARRRERRERRQR